METISHLPESGENNSDMDTYHGTQETIFDIPENRNGTPKDHTLREAIVGPAWNLVMSTSFIKKFNFFPSLLSTIYLGCIVLYQIAFSYVYIFKLKDQFFALIIQWVHTSYFWQVIGALVIGIILYIFITPIAE